MKFDLHLHTSRHSHDSETDPFDMLESARKAGLDGVVLTERDYVRQKAVELLEKCTF